MYYVWYMIYYVWFPVLWYSPFGWDIPLGLRPSPPSQGGLWVFTHSVGTKKSHVMSNFWFSDRKMQILDGFSVIFWIYDLWCLIYDVWCMMFDLWCMNCGCLPIRLEHPPVPLHKGDLFMFLPFARGILFRAVCYRAPARDAPTYLKKIDAGHFTTTGIQRVNSTIVFII